MYAINLIAVSSRPPARLGQTWPGRGVDSSGREFFRRRDPRRRGPDVTSAGRSTSPAIPTSTRSARVSRPKVKDRRGGAAATCPHDGHLDVVDHRTVRAHASGRVRLPSRHRAPHPLGSRAELGLKGGGPKCARHRAGRLDLSRRRARLLPALTGREPGRDPRGDRFPARGASATLRAAGHPRPPSWGGAAVPLRWDPLAGAQVGVLAPRDRTELRARCWPGPANADRRRPGRRVRPATGGPGGGPTGSLRGTAIRTTGDFPREVAAGCQAATVRRRPGVIPDLRDVPGEVRPRRHSHFPPPPLPRPGHHRRRRRQRGRSGWSCSAAGFAENGAAGPSAGRGGCQRPGPGEVRMVGPNCFGLGQNAELSAERLDLGLGGYPRAAAA